MEHISKLIPKQGTNIAKKVNTDHWSRVKSLSPARTVTEAIEQKAPTLKMLEREDSEKTTTLMMHKIIKLRQLLDLDKDMSIEEIKATSEVLVQNWKQLTSADLHVVFDQILSGKLGKDYHRLDAHTIGGFFQEYLDRRPIKILPFKL